MNIQKRHVLKEAKKLGANITETQYNAHDQSYSFDIEAPDGKQWSENGTQFIIVTWFKYNPESKPEAFLDALDFMSYGLEDFKE
jgi:hypothetical protein